jgi:hypothetical protein
MSRWRGDAAFAPAASKSIRFTVARHLEDAFSNRQSLSFDGAAMRCHVSKWSIELLVQIALHDGIGLEMFQNYFDGFATDSFSQMTRHRTFLDDRQRAIILLAVAGLVAYERSDTLLLEAVRNAAKRLVLQPAGGVEVVDSRNGRKLRQDAGSAFQKNDHRASMRTQLEQQYSLWA